MPKSAVWSGLPPFSPVAFNSTSDVPAANAASSTRTTYRPLRGMAIAYAPFTSVVVAMALKSAAHLARRPVFAEYRDLYRRPLTVGELDRFGAIVLDPPRAGAREQMAALAACRVGAIAYVSCDPATFARDAKILCDAGWRIDWVRPVGQFRWSTHVELAARFSR